ncbi:hypothetical protein DFH09DRAFT_1176245 [Mycena vulgaris]|nr:hypothetical protein DFH09DRAFT_1176245 [Mycena vulgaris]
MTSTSSFAPNLGTIYCPEDGEIAQIRTLLVEPTLRLERLGGEIADMQKAIDKLKEERDALIAYVEAHKALISPVRRLPLDVIQEIFLVDNDVTLNTPSLGETSYRLAYPLLRSHHSVSRGEARAAAGDHKDLVRALGSLPLDHLAGRWRRLTEESEPIVG